MGKNTQKRGECPETRLRAEREKRRSGRREGGFYG